MTRAQRLVHGRSYIRPYVQAFLIGGELEMERPEYGSYLLRQLDGVQAAAGSGFTLWNASNRYYMVTESLLPYTTVPRDDAAVTTRAPAAGEPATAAPSPPAPSAPDAGQPAGAVAGAAGPGAAADAAAAPSVEATP